MKRLRYKSLIYFFSLIALTSCDYEYINTNQLEMTPEMGKMDGLAVGARMTKLMTSVIPVGTQADATDIVNQYQIAYHLSTDIWGGYFCENNNWNKGFNTINYFMTDNWMAASFRASYTDILPIWKEIKEASEKIGDPEAFALAQILKISAWQKATDMFGPIPYKQAGEPLLSIPYDSQEEVYSCFLKDLSDAIDILTPRAEVDSKYLSSYDIVYKGDVRKWVKYANSLMLRMSMRIRFANPEEAQKYAEKAITHPIGVMMNKEDQAKVDEGAGLVFKNNIETLANQYNEARMSSSMFAYLVGYDDPRLPKYYQTTSSQYAVETPYGKYQALPTGHDYPQNDTYKEMSKPNIDVNTPTYWMRSSEVYFLRAEGALIGWSMGGTAEELYKKGIEMSFIENDIDPSLVESYISSGKEPVNWNLDIKNLSGAANAPTKAVVKWEGSDENLLEKIQIQKWLALYPNGMEAWSEIRRTGYPKLHPVMENNSGGTVSTDYGVRRMVYPSSERKTKEQIAVYEEAVKLLSGEDAPSTNLWWDKKKH